MLEAITIPEPEHFFRVRYLERDQECKKITVHHLLLKFYFTALVDGKGRLSLHNKME
jgi:hypothetical protein